MQSGKSLLWRISGKDMKRPSYLFGTIHLICPADYIWTDKMKESLHKSQEVCFEMDMDDPGVLMKVATGLMDNSGKRLEDYFSPEQYKQVATYMHDSIGMNISLFDNLKPAALQSMLTTKTAACANPVSYEDKIMEQAKKDKKEILGLEQPEEQIELFDNLPPDSIVKQVMETVTGKDNDKEEYQKLVNAYKQQDLPALYELMNSSGESPIDLAGFLDDRNKRWIDRMVDKMDQKSVFFAVGAGHLWGENGVINLLKKEGYRVEPVR
ncbi:MAG: hypothetical protein BGO69_09265 [Bacteroidetes bacterium 46-16]|nr:MAG: hypothetical protein BGO69_09265 [Bacteroidetes bacterium 46-16]